MKKEQAHRIVQPPSFFPDLDPPITERVRRRLSGAPRERATPKRVADNPCRGCPLDGQTRVKPSIPTEHDCVAIGIGPGRVEIDSGVPMTGEGGQLLRTELRRAGLDSARVGFANLTECRPEDGVFHSAVWERAQKRCIHHLLKNLHGSSKPLLLLGGDPLAKLLPDGAARLAGYRGLWTYAALPERTAFVVDHPAALVRMSAAERSAALPRYRALLRRFASELAGRDDPAAGIVIFSSPIEAARSGFLRRLAARRRPWVFDVESFDGAACPSRKKVPTDPCHPDFRLRGFAVGWRDGDEPPVLVWIDCLSMANDIPAARAVLSPAFASSASKIAFNGHFDEQAVTYPGWVERVVNRSADAFFAALLLGDGTRASNTLARLTVDLLGKSNHWQVDKQRMGELSIEKVARGAGGDVLYTFDLCRMLHERLKRGEYL